MKISDLCIKRPIFTLVINILLVVVGLVGFLRLEVRDLPKMEIGTATITTMYPGADGRLIENEITSVIEEEIAGVEGINFITSQSQNNSSVISIYFRSGYDVNIGMNNLRDRLGAVVNDLPEDAEAPVLEKADINASPTMYIAFTTNGELSDMAVTDYVRRNIKVSIEQVEGVGTAPILGGREFSMRIYPDPARMASRNIDASDISNVLNSQNVNVAGGELKSKERNYTLLPQTRVPSVGDFSELILKSDEKGFVRLGDVADVRLGPLDDNEIVRANYQPVVIVAVVPQSTANPVTMSEKVNALLLEASKTLPAGMGYSVVYDEAVFIDASIKGVYSTLIEAVVLVVLVVFGFLGSMRSSLIPIVTIPVCLIATFGLVYAMGYSINTMTLLALVLAIGLVVDDAIVMLENVHRHIEAGLSPMAAAFKGSREIGFAVVAMTITLAAVYAPIGFTPGLTGDVFREFAFTLAAAVIISGFVALTLSPMMCSRMMRHESNRFIRWLDTSFDKLKNGYRNKLKKVLDIRGTALAIVGVIAILGGFLFNSLSSELAPTEDQGIAIVFMIGPRGANVDYLDFQLKQLENLYKGLPEYEDYVAILGYPQSSQGISFLKFKPWADRDRSQNEIVEGLRKQTLAIPGAIVVAAEMPSLSTSGGDYPVEFVIQATGTFEEIQEIVATLQAKMNMNSMFNMVQTDLNLDKPERDLILNRDLISNLGIPMTEVNQAIASMLAGRTITKFNYDGENYDVKVQLHDKDRMNANQIGNIYVNSSSGKAIPLSSILEVKDSVGAEVYPHYNRLRSASITSNLNPGFTQGDAVTFINESMPELLPSNMKYSWAGQTLDFVDSSGAMLMTTILALTFIYLVLAAQFESWRDPLIIMLTVPFSIIGAVLLLKLTGGTNNIYTQIGFVTLIGLITKHGILITEFANQLQEEGKDMREAVMESAALRLRPILMTTGAMVLGAIPLALASGAGAYARQQLGVVIVGGMTIGTIFSLIIVPIVYTLLAEKRTRIDEQHPLSVALREAEK
jgi:multidrug efflux pump